MKGAHTKKSKEIILNKNKEYREYHLECCNAASTFCSVQIEKFYAFCTQQPFWISLMLEII